MVIICILLTLFYSVLFLKNAFVSMNTTDRVSLYMAPITTLTIKGFFVILIFLSHFCSYVDISSPYDKGLYSFCSFFGQLIVVPFLFFSGYGVFESIKKKGASYVRSFPKKRIAKVLLNFDLAILVFLLLNQILGIQYDLPRVFLSFIAWSDVGNSNWFIFAIIITYLITYFSFLLKIQQRNAIMLVGLMTCIYVVAIMLLKKGEPWWWNTVICYPIGMLYSYYKEPIERKFLIKKGAFICTALSLAIAFTIVKANVIPVYAIASQLNAIIFSLLLVCISWISPVQSKILNWFGKYVFEIYILQRIALNLFKYLKINENVYIYFAVCTAMTLIIAVLFKMLTDKIWKNILGQ